MRQTSKFSDTAYEVYDAVLPWIEEFQISMLIRAREKKIIITLIERDPRETSDEDGHLEVPNG